MDLLSEEDEGVDKTEIFFKEMWEKLNWTSNSSSVTNKGQDKFDNECKNS